MRNVLVFSNFDGTGVDARLVFGADYIYYIYIVAFAAALLGAASIIIVFQVGVQMLLVFDNVWKVSILYRRLNHFDIRCDIRYKSKTIARVGRI